MRFRDRADAGRQLGALLNDYANRSDVLVLALPRGGVPVAFEVAAALCAPLDVLLVRKLGVPGHPELAMGAIASGGIEVLSEGLIQDLRIPRALVQQVALRERVELERRDRVFRGVRQPPALRDRTVILVDDGLATGSTMEAAILAVRQGAPARIVVAVPVGARETCERLRRLADEVICAATPELFTAVGLWYEQFTQTTDEEVIRLLSAGPNVSADQPPREFAPTPVSVPCGDRGLHGDLGVPPSARGMVVFAHGSGSSRRSPRNKYVAGVLVQAGFGTLLIDLLTTEEEAIDERTGRLRFDINLLAGRLVGIVDWLRARHDVSSLPIGLFGASTGAAAALVTAAERPHAIAAIVSRGGRPDLAETALSYVAAPTLLIVGSLDAEVIQMNRAAMAQMPGEVVLNIVPGATHLFEEPGALARVAVLAAGWFGRHLEAGHSVHAHAGHARSRRQ